MYDGVRAILIWVGSILVAEIYKWKSTLSINSYDNANQTNLSFWTALSKSTEAVITIDTYFAGTVL